MTLSIQEIQQQFQHQRFNSKVRHREVAHSMGISEAELLAAHLGPDHANGNTNANINTNNSFRAIRFEPHWASIISEVHSLGEVMALTRNESCVHEKVGAYGHPTGKNIDLLLGKEIDLRIFYKEWAHGFAVIEKLHLDCRRSLQFFDHQGNAIHKIIITEDSNIIAFEKIIEKFQSKNQDPKIEIQAPAINQHPLINLDIDVLSFQKDWLGMSDTHQFYDLIKQYKLSRIQALRFAPEGHAQRVPLQFTRELLRKVAIRRIPIMVFVANHGVIQIHTGPISRVVMLDPWLNVLDKNFNLHLREDDVYDTWIVRKPTDDGIVTSLELFDSEGQAIVMFFGERKPGISELDAWRKIIHELLAKEELCIQ
jgi:putative hemin transport protein